MTTHLDGGPSFSVVVGRIFWIMIGPLLLVVLGYRVFLTAPDGWLTPADLGFLGILALLVVVRCLEFRSERPQKATGEPATTQDLRRYVVAAILLGLLAWIGANLLGGNQWLNP